MDKRYWTFKTFETDLETVWKEYQVIVMRYIWKIGEEGAGSGKSWEATNLVLKESGKSISRASIIFFLNDMVDEGVLKFVERTGKGGHHRIYRPAFDEEAFKEFLAEKIIGHLMNEFPDETKKTLEKMKPGKSLKSLFTRGD